MNDTSMISNQQNEEMKEEPSNSIENQTRNSSLNKNNNHLMEESPYGDSILGVSFKIEISPDPDLTEEKVIMILYSKVEELIHQWIQYKDIEGIFTKEHKLITKELNKKATE